MSHDNPQNPYQSFAVIASAGSGKTYQLSRRVLSLVSAGADVSSILGITFTQKAALEMKERIILDAARLSHDTRLQKEFNEQMQEFYRTFAQKNKVAPPRKALEIANLILSQSCQIRMSTMDSCFLMWARKYYFNRFFALANDRDLEILSQQSLDQLIEQALEDSLDYALTSTEGQVLVRELGVPQVKRLLSEWYGRVQGLDAEKTRHPDFLFYPSSFDTEFDATTLWQQMHSSLTQIGAELDSKFQDPIRQALALRSVLPLVESGLVKQDGSSLSGTYLRGKKKEALAAPIGIVNESLGILEAYQKISWLLQTGSNLHNLGLYLKEKILERQSQLCALTFSDITQAAKDLFTSGDFSGERYLIHHSIRHLLLDEFQDTSRIQYEVLQSLSQEILSGEGIDLDVTGLRPSLFIVGDTKQAIYGFRNADAALLEEASESLSASGLIQTSLNASYRSTQTIMQFCNSVFPGLMYNYVDHSVAVNTSGEDLHPDISSVTFVESVLSDLDQQLGRSAQAVEAEDLATFLTHVFSRPQDYPVYDKQEKAFRDIRKSDCAILYRSGTHSQTLLSALKKAKLSARLEGDQDFWNTLIVKDLLAWFRYLVDPHSASQLLRVLKSYYSPLQESEALVCLRSPENADFIKDNIQDEEFRAFLSAYNLCYKDGLTPYSIFIKFRPFLLRSLDHNLLPDIAEQFIGRLGEFELWLADLDRRGVHSLVQVLQESYEQSTVLMEELKSDSIVVMSIHKSKGLEYPMICLVHSDKKWEKRDSYWVRARVPFQDTRHVGLSEQLAFIGNADQRPKMSTEINDLIQSIDDEAREESKRLLYVALTRARQYLVISAIPSKEEVSNLLYSSLCGAFHTICSGAKNPEVALRGYELSKRSTSRVKEFLSLGLIERRMSIERGKFNEPTKLIEPGKSPDLECAGSDQAVNAKEDGDQHSPPSRAPLYILSPSDGASKESPKVSEQVPALHGPSREQAKIFGTVLHAGLEHAVKTRSTTRPPWENLLRRHDPLRTLAPHVQTSLQSHFDVCIQSEEFQNILFDSEQLHSEYSFVRVVGERLVQGSMDLVAQFSDRIVLIDFKTGADFHEHLEDYKRQMQYYRKALEKGLGRTQPILSKLFWIHDNKLEIISLDQA